ncbi:MAG: ribosome maturation factor RimM [Mariprofundaceae bacterium]|nr:ribosome maturation factor RimM [Mariprofundaceae bacterium]
MLEVGVIQKAHGLKGALTVYSHTRPAIGIAGYSFWYLGSSEQSVTRYQMIRCWQHGRRILAELQDVVGIHAAEKLEGLKIWVPASEVEVDEEEFLWQDLIGCAVIQENGDLLGEVSALEEYGAQDIITVQTPDSAMQQGEWMLPFIEQVILDVDLDAKRITVALPEGMDACFTPRF